MEFGGFKTGHGPHRMRMLPVVDLAYAYRCEGCPGYARFPWVLEPREFENIDQAGEAHTRTLAGYLLQEVAYAGMLPERADTSVMAQMAAAGVVPLDWLEKVPCACAGACPCHKEGP